jgi:multicomponent Na+:H+ antiporter subunit F
MSGAEFLYYATSIAFALLGLSIALVFVHFVRGPTLADRILCLDMITTLAASGIGVFALRTALYLYVDIAVAIVLVGALSTTAFARYLLSRRPGDWP